MPFGLESPPRTFEQMIVVATSAAKWEFALVYLDVIVVDSRSAAEHIHHVRHVLSPSRGAGVTLKLKNCILLAEILDCFGYAIRPRRLEIAS